ncbi:ABC transporter ATP-binding protein [Ureibacillus chungkukjangi]|uniref:NitT/TauT family transport system ATP-binding protein n=1 Tax=Ureibacillus chungkukjangi TaxID=1202712 RepID=A0A318TNK0_9BACL|nr:ABC transporter ATP-binding protein [Ureibacillus chungkukjangi]PYF06442.1 NitT/TauT family transport system ATP-binding protein [Ureibacillus chungkukjangi]
MSFLSVSNVHHTYFSKEAATEALQDINLTIDKGEFVSFIGPSGCGKTTLLSIIAGLFEPTSGSVHIENQEVYGNKDLSIGYMLQQDYLFPWKTIEENITLGLKLLKQEKKSFTNVASSLLSDVGLPPVEKKYPRELSGGMRQRVALARTLAVDPKILLLDEPFSALDYQSKLKLEDLVSNKLKEYGKTAVLVTHDIGEAIAMSDRIFLFSARPGKLHQTFLVPEELRTLTPFEARAHSSYSSLFQTIWKELESLE